MCLPNLLIVDEGSFSTGETVSRLRQKNLTENYVRSSVEAFHLLEKEKGIDVVLVIAGESELECIAMIELFKNHFPLVEVILISAHANIHSAIEAVKIGAFDYLNASCDVEHLIGRVIEAGARKRQRESEILDIRMQPYLTEGVRREMIAEVLGRRYKL